MILATPVAWLVDKIQARHEFEARVMGAGVSAPENNIPADDDVAAALRGRKK